MTLADAWEEHAGDWISWARSSELDGFRDGTWPELASLVPSPSGRTVEIGCGEGRASRQLIDLGHEVIAVEQSITLAAAAASGDPCVRVIRSDCAALPLASGAFRLVMACMVLQDVDDLVGTVQEASRVLVPGGAFCFAIVHPFASAQEPESFHGTGPPVITTPYLRERRYTDRVERPEGRMTFVSVHRPLSVYVDALGRAGLFIDAIREFGDGSLPWLLVSRATKRL